MYTSENVKEFNAKKNGSIAFSFVVKKSVISEIIIVFL
jgi:hypothetical protein